MKIIAGPFVAFLLVVFFSANVFSQIAMNTEPEKKPVKAATTNGKNFTDNNKNGVCDQFEARQVTGHGKNFTDKNGDGVCDNRGNGNKGNGNCCGAGPGNGNCCGKGAGQGNGCGFGHQHRHGCNTPQTTKPAK